MFIVLLISVGPTAAEKSWRKRWRKRRQSLPAMAKACCLVKSGMCQSPGKCCHTASLEAGAASHADTADSCAAQPSRLQCEASVPVEPRVGQDVCVWIGGQCSSGTEVDCAEPWRRINWYGETDGFEMQCGHRVCPGFLAAFTNYAAAHNAATRQCVSPMHIYICIHRHKSTHPHIHKSHAHEHEHTKNTNTHTHAYTYDAAPRQRMCERAHERAHRRACHTP